MNRRALFLLVLSLFYFLSYAPHAEALSCAVPKDPDEALLFFGNVVLGEVVQVKGDIEQEGFIGAKEYVRNILVQVEMSWGIEVDSQVIIATNYTWGYDYQEGNSYLIYVTEHEGKLINSPCSTTVGMNSLSEATRLLGNGHLPVNEVNLAYRMWFMFDYDIDLLIILAVIILGLAIVIYVTARIRKR